MKRKNHFRPLIVLLSSLVLILGLMAGCATRENQPPQDSFFEQWRLQAGESRGYSPTHELETVDLGEIISPVDEIAEPEPLRPLPRTSVTLHLRSVPIDSILRAMARAANQNIIVNPTISGDTSIHLHQVPWDQAFRGLLATHGLTYTWEGDIIRVMTVEDMEHELRLAAVRERKDALNIELARVAPFSSQIVKINYANADELRDVLATMLTKGQDGVPRGALVVDRHSNSMIIQASAEDLGRIGRMLTILDRPRPQVLIEATIVETTKEVARELGIQWTGRYLTGTRQMRGITSNLDPTDLASAVGSDTNIGGMFDGDGNPITSVLGLMYGTHDRNYLGLQLQALQRDGKVNILSSPSITTMDNQMAYTENGTRVPVVTVTDGDRTVRYEDAVLRLEITPNVIDNNNLKMKIAVKKDEVDLSRTVDGNPFIITKQTETNLNVGNTETIVISGLTKQHLADGNSGVPGLKDIPALGWLFKGERKSDSMEEVLIFLTPTILPKRTLVGGN